MIQSVSEPQNKFNINDWTWFQLSKIKFHFGLERLLCHKHQYFLVDLNEFPSLVVAGCDLDGAWAQVHAHKLVSNDGQGLLAEGVPHALANQVLVAAVPVDQNDDAILKQINGPTRRGNQQNQPLR